MVNSLMVCGGQCKKNRKKKTEIEQRSHFLVLLNLTTSKKLHSYYGNSKQNKTKSDIFDNVKSQISRMNCEKENDDNYIDCQNGKEDILENLKTFVFKPCRIKK